MSLCGIAEGKLYRFVLRSLCHYLWADEPKPLLTGRPADAAQHQKSHQSPSSSHINRNKDSAGDKAALLLLLHSWHRLRSLPTALLPCVRNSN